MSAFENYNCADYLTNYLRIKTISITQNALVEIVRKKINRHLYIAKHLMKSNKHTKNEVNMNLEIRKIPSMEDKICRIEEIYETGTHYILILEYINGSDLFYFLDNTYRYYYMSSFMERQEFYVKMMSSIFMQIIECINILHKKDILHLDIKLENIMLKKDCNCPCNKKCKSIHNCKCLDLPFQVYEHIDNFCDCSNICSCICCGKYKVVIIDFNFSQYYNIETISKQWRGTPAYCPPEVCQMYINNNININYNRSNDMWAVGIILYSIITNQYPFQVKEYNNYKYLLKNELIIKEKLRQVNIGKFDPKYMTILEGLLHFYPNERFSAEKVLSLL